jgi:molybdate transport system substrate-binding protein
MPARRSVHALVAAAVLPIALAGCASGAAGGTPTSTEDAMTGQVVVLAAASLTETFDALAAEFEDANPGVDVVISYGGSSALAEQLIGGARSRASPTSPTPRRRSRSAPPRCRAAPPP